MGVFAMLYGTERNVVQSAAVKPHERTSEHNQNAEPSALLNLATVGAFCVGFGLSGYEMATYSSWPLYVMLIVAALAGGAALAMQSLLIARWAIPSARAEHIDERYLLQGTLGCITQDIAANGEGMMRYALDDSEFELPARDMHNQVVASGTDVVIDRVEQGVAYVELWSLVEQRL